MIVFVRNKKDANLNLFKQLKEEKTLAIFPRCASTNVEAPLKILHKACIFYLHKSLTILYICHLAQNTETHASIIKRSCGL